MADRLGATKGRRRSLRDAFQIDGRVVVITGGGGLLGRQHARTVAELGGIPILLDIDLASAEDIVAELRGEFGCAALALMMDVTNEQSVEKSFKTILETHQRLDVLINNAAINPKRELGHGEDWSRLENFSLSTWNKEIAVGLTGAFLCSKAAGTVMARTGGGIILNISSDLGMIAPDQRLYASQNLPPELQPVKPVTYSVVKAGLIGLTRYLATYWPLQGVRCNALCPGGVENGQDKDFIERISSLVPMGRMARIAEYNAAVAFLISDASSYMNGGILSIDGGRTAW